MDSVSSDEFPATVQADRGRFDRILQSVLPEPLSEPILPGGWSGRDVLAHVAWGSARESVWFARALVGSDLWDLSEDERNEAVVRESRSLGVFFPLRVRPR